MKKALIIGIDNYPDAELRGCVNDATAVTELLRTNGSGAPNFDVKQLLNTGSRAELKREITNLFSDDTDVALLYFSGHGTAEDGGYLVTPDYQDGDWGVPMSYILSSANKSKCKNKVIVLDCCYSGKFGESDVIQSDESVLGEGITVMTASSRDQTSLEYDGQGVFTNLFLQGLRGSAADITGRITPAGIYSFIDQSLGAWEQRPIFKTNTKQFLSLRDVDPKVPKSTLRKLKFYFRTPSEEFQLDPSFEFTNDPMTVHKTIEPYADATHVEKFRDLQLFESVGLVEPVDESHMYFAAMKSKSCRLTALGLRYWRLSKDDRF
jgi:hypothetical protein